MKIVEREISSLIPYEFNNKIHNSKQINHIANSIKEFGFTQPIVIDKNSIIIIGHGRLEGAKKLGLEKVPTVVMEDLTENQIKKLRILDNKLNESERDIENLKIELEDLGDLNIGDIEIEVEDLFPEIGEGNKTDKEIKDVEVKVSEKAKIVKKGDIFELGKHRLLCGDSTNENDVEILMGGEKADIMFTSPPYNVGKSAKLNAGMRGDNSKYENDNDDKTDDEYKDFLSIFTRLALQYSEYAFVNIQSLSNNKIGLIDYLYEMKEFYADTIIWDKGWTAPAMGENVLNSSFEYVHIFSHKGNRAIGTIPFRGTLQNIVHINGQTNNEFSNIHSATFPIDFARHFIENFCRERVLDMFGGTGTSMIVAEQLGKKSYLMELDPLYCELIIKRFHKLKPDAGIKCTNRDIDINSILS